jgi:hypothetical protein
VVARRQEKLRPQREAQIGCLHARRLVFVAQVVKRSPQGFLTPMQSGMAIPGQKRLARLRRKGVLRIDPFARPRVREV